MDGLGELVGRKTRLQIIFKFKIKEFVGWAI